MPEKTRALPVWPVLWTITCNALASGPLQHALRNDYARLLPGTGPRFSPTLGVSERLAASVWAPADGRRRHQPLRERRGNRPAPWRPVRMPGAGLGWSP